MPYGSGQMIRHALVHTKPWQRYVIAGAMIVGGAGLAVFGHVAGSLLSAAGVVLVWRMLQFRHRALHGGRPGHEAADSERDGEIADDSP